MELSFSEIVVVCLVAFLVFGPEDFIRRSRQLGVWLGRMRTQAQNFRVMAEEEFAKKSALKDVKDLGDNFLEVRAALKVPGVEKKESGAGDV